MKKTNMAASTLLNSIIQLSQYYEERSPLLFIVSLRSMLTITSESPVMDWFSYYTQGYILCL